jgi:hypothetical protein
MEAEPTYDGCADAGEDATAVAPEPEVADAAPRGPLPSMFTRLARFSTHTRRWHAIDPAPGGRGDGAGSDE